VHAAVTSGHRGGDGVGDLILSKVVSRDDGTSPAEVRAGGQIGLDVPVPPGSQPAIGNPLAPNATPGTQSPGAPWALCITPGPNQVLYASDAFPGRIYKVSLDGKILGVLGKSGKQLKQFGWIHEIACPSENELYVAEILNWRVQKLQLHPRPSGTR